MERQRAVVNKHFKKATEWIGSGLEAAVAFGGYFYCRMFDASECSYIAEYVTKVRNKVNVVGELCVCGGSNHSEADGRSTEMIERP